MKFMKSKRFRIKLLTSTLLLFILIGIINATPTFKATSYVYDYWKNIIPSTEGITYKETYYNKDIKMASDPSISLNKFSLLVDLEVYDGNIYMLDSCANETSNITLGDGPHLVTGVSKLYVINQNFLCEKIFNEFVLTDYAKTKLEDFYNFHTELDKITVEQFTSTEFVDIKEVTNYENVIDSDGSVTFEFVKKNDDDIKIYVDDTLLDETEYTVTVLENSTKYDFTSSLAGRKVKLQRLYITTYGKAPYLPYSLDNTKAAVRLNSAEGITITKDAVYIADTENARILKLNHDFEVIDVYLTPEDSAFYQMSRSGYETPYGMAYQTLKATSSIFNSITSDDLFRPKKVAVTPSGVCYCIAANIYEGLVEFGVDTEFNRFLGQNTVYANPLKTFLSNFFTEEQLASFALSLPPMFNNIAISSDGFLYATSDPTTDSSSNTTIATNMVKIINTKGNDIMKRNGYVKPDGDAVYLLRSEQDDVVIGPSVLTAVAVSRTGNFTVSDRTRGRLFTYDSEGNLLYITGDQPGGTKQAGKGNGLSNSIINPVALDYLYRTSYDSLGNATEEETVIVLDASSSSIILFETTEFGEVVNIATALYQNGVIMDTYKVGTDGEYILDENGNKIVESMGAESYWRQVIKMNTNYELAYLGIGKALLRRDENDEAMYYFKLAHSATYYSKAYANHRDEVLNQNFNLIMTVVIAFVVLYVVNKVTKNIIAKNKNKPKEGGNQ